MVAGKIASADLEVIVRHCWLPNANSAARAVLACPSTRGVQEKHAKIAIKVNCQGYAAGWVSAAVKGVFQLFR